jgi:hypothetical protein
MSKFQVGQKVRVISDTFEADPHGRKIGEVHTIQEVQPATPWEEFPTMVRLLFAMQGKENIDLPERYLVRFGPDENDYTNFVDEDIELVEKEQGKTIQIEMLEDGWLEEYEEGQQFTATLNPDDGRYYFIDNDGDTRPVDAHHCNIIG